MEINYLIKSCGGTFGMARLLGVSAPAVSQWKRTGAVPVRRLYELKDKRPDLFRTTPTHDGGEKETADAALVCGDSSS